MLFLNSAYFLFPAQSTEWRDRCSRWRLGLAPGQKILFSFPGIITWMTRSLLSIMHWAGARPKDRVFFSRHNHLNDEITRSLLSIMHWAGARPKDRVFFYRHNYLNDEIAALDDALGWRQTNRSCFLFHAQSPEWRDCCSWWRHGLVPDQKSGFSFSGTITWMMRSLRSMTRQSWRQTKRSCFLFPAQYSPEWRDRCARWRLGLGPDKKDPVSFLGTITWMTRSLRSMTRQSWRQNSRFFS